MFCNVQSSMKRIKTDELLHESQNMKIICLSETWLHGEIEDEDLKHYTH